MPANKKYLTSSKWQRFAKITAGLVGGLTVCVALHTAVATWFYRPAVMVTATFTTYLLWAGLLILAFLAKNGWAVWASYLLLSLLFFGITYLGK